MNKLQMAREQQTAARAAVAAKHQAREQARTALENAPVPEGKALADLPEFKALRDASAEYESAASASVAADEAVTELVALMGEGKGSKYANITPVTGKYGPEEAGGFKSLGEFIQAVAFKPSELAKRGIEFKAEQSTTGTTGTDGGFPLPTLFQQQILQLATPGLIVRQRATVIPGGDMPDAEVKILALNQVGSGNLYGGVAVTWEDDEAATDATATTAKLVPYVSVKPKSVRATITETNKVIRNEAYATPLLTNLMAKALYGSEDYQFLSGAAAGTVAPVGVRSCDGMIYIHRQTASTVVWEDVLAMVGALSPESREKAVFVANQNLYPVLRDIKDKAGNRIYWTGDPSKGVADTLDGIPVIYTGKVGTKGAKGDLILCDFTYYLVKDGMEMLISISDQQLFTKDKTIIKINRSVDGKGWITGPLTLEDGATTVSPFVGLDIPAA